MSKLRASFHAVLSLSFIGTALLVAFPAGPPAAPRPLASAPLDAIATASLNPNKPHPLPDTGPVLAYAREGAPRANDANLALAAPPPILMDITGLREAIAAYRAGDLKAGDAAAQTTTNPTARTAADWAALRLMPRETGFDRIAAFLKAQPGWPTAAALRRRAEEAIYYDKRPPAEVIAWFSSRRPETAMGKWTLARALQAANPTQAAALAREVWREADLTPSLETALRKDFPDALTRADHKARSDRLFYKDNAAASLRAALLAGADVLALAKARETPSDKTIAAVSPELRKDPSLQFAQIQKLRKDNKIDDAVKAMLEAPRDPALLVNADEWWTERRALARCSISVMRCSWRWSCRDRRCSNTWVPDEDLARSRRGVDHLRAGGGVGGDRHVRRSSAARSLASAACSVAPAARSVPSPGAARSARARRGIGRDRHERRGSSARPGRAPSRAAHHADIARLRHLARRPENPAHCACRPHRVPQRVARIHLWQPPAIHRPAMRHEIPPGNAVVDEHNRRIRPQQRGDRLRHRRQRRRLHRHQHRILLTKLGRIGAGGDRPGHVLIRCHHAQAICADRRQMRAACDDGHLRPAQRKAHRQMPANGAGAKDADFHDSISSAARASACTPSPMQPSSG
jgi:hypothetical protein